MQAPKNDSFSSMFDAPRARELPPMGHLVLVANVAVAAMNGCAMAVIVRNRDCPSVTSDFLHFFVLSTLALVAGVGVVLLGFVAARACRRPADVPLARVVAAPSPEPVGPAATVGPAVVVQTAV